MMRAVWFWRVLTLGLALGICNGAPAAEGGVWLVSKSSGERMDDDRGRRSRPHSASKTF